MVLKTLDGEKWRRFCADHGPDFSQTVFVPSMVSDTAVIEAHILAALAAATERTGPHDRVLPRIRVFRGSALDYEATERVTFGDFGGGDLFGWLRSVSRDPLCVAFNEVDSWNQDLADLLYAEVTAPLVGQIGDLQAGLEWYSFIGESGWTPFGIHFDSEPSMIFHLGPVPKRVWVWDRATLPELPNGRGVSLDFAHLLPSAEQFVLEPGDFLSIPAHSLHVFENAGPSVFLGLTIFPFDSFGQQLDVLNTLIRDAAGAQGAEEAATMFQKIDAASLEAEISRARMRRRSRGYSKGPRRSAVATAAHLIEQTRFRVTRRPVTASRCGAGDVVVHAGGRDVRLPRGVSETALIKLLSEQAFVSGAQVIESIQPGGDTPVAVEIVQALERCWALRPEAVGAVGAESS